MKNHEPQEAAVGSDRSISAKYEVIKLGIDWHARQYRVSRVIDGAGPEPGQRFTPEGFLAWVQKQQRLAARVVTCYEAGAGGYALHRQLQALGVINYVVAPRSLDPHHRGVQNDATDARELAQGLDRFLGGNPKAMRVVHVPTPEQEIRRQQGRLRSQLRSQRLRLCAQGRSLLLTQGILESNSWWKPTVWPALHARLAPWLVENLEIYRRLIVQVDAEVKALSARIVEAATKLRPKGMGALTCELLEREVVDWERFENRKAPGGYLGLGGGVLSSGTYKLDLPITKAGSSRLRALLIELAWRWVFYQPQCPLIQRWRHVLLRPGAHPSARKRAIVAVARQLFVDLWRWRTGRATPEGLHWKMVAA